MLDKIWLEDITLFTVYFFDEVKDILSKVKPISELRKIVNDQKINLQTNEPINWLNLIQIVSFNLLDKMKQMENLEHPMIVSFKELSIKSGTKRQKFRFCKTELTTLFEVPWYSQKNWADDKQISWIIALWWLSVSLWRICITFLWPSKIFCIDKTVPGTKPPGGYNQDSCR